MGEVKLVAEVQGSRLWSRPMLYKGNTKASIDEGEQDKRMCKGGMK